MIQTCSYPITIAPNSLDWGHEQGPVTKQDLHLTTDVKERRKETWVSHGPKKPDVGHFACSVNEAEQLTC